MYFHKGAKVIKTFISDYEGRFINKRRDSICMYYDTLGKNSKIKICL